MIIWPHKRENSTRRQGLRWMHAKDACFIANLMDLLDVSKFDRLSHVGGGTSLAGGRKTGTWRASVELAVLVSMPMSCRSVNMGPCW